MDRDPWLDQQENQDIASVVWEPWALSHENSTTNSLVMNQTLAKYGLFCWLRWGAAFLGSEPWALRYEHLPVD